jgi:ubiquinol-cytochrome c reductase cytochrome b subunit
MLPKALLDALEDRTGYRGLLKEALGERIPGGASWAYVLGSATLILFLVQLGTGLVLAMYYSPSATDAWASVAYVERAVPGGALVRGLHHHAAGAMVVMAGLHMLQVVLWGAYKAPREGNWLTGMMLLGLVLSFALTGYLLPWDQTGYWATKVATSIAGTVPGLGPYLQPIAQGGNDYGSLTLTRFYALHVIAFPIATLGLIGAHMYFFRRHGVTPSARLDEGQLAAREELFWPKQVLLDAVFAAAVVGVLLYVAATVGAPLQAPADPSSNFIARPEWYFLFLFQLLKYFEGPLQVVGTVVIPGLASTFLLALPFLDRRPSRALRHRLPFVGALAAGLVCIAGLTALAVRHDAADPTIHAQKGVAAREAARAKALAAQGVPPEGATYMMAHDPLTRGERLFWRECASCHVLEGRGPKTPEAPDLTGYLSKAWLRQVLRDPDSHRLFGLTKVEGMKSFAKLPDAELSQLVELLHQLRQPDLPPLEARPGAALLETHECGDCHDFEERYGLEGPSLFQYGSAEWVRAVVDDPGHEALYGAANTMPVFRTRLSEADRAAAVVFLLSLEERADPTRWPHVDDPGPVPTPRTTTSSAAD